ncbi:MAG: AMP-binding protein [Desulfobacteraceae bacterium]|nr:AMP-binding protein [Desulfobacteraceae bacterium]
MAQEISDTLSYEQIRQLQSERLQMTLNRAYLHVDFYRRRMDSLRLLPEDIAGIEGLRNFPFTTRRDLTDHYPYGLFAVSLKSIVRLKITSPPLRDTEKPIVIGFTRHDVRMWQSLLVRLYSQLGVTDRDIVQVAFNFSLFPGAFTFNYAAEEIGATLAPSATNSAVMQLQIMRDFRSTILATTAAFALHIVSTMEEQGIDPQSLHLRLLLVGPDPLPETTREKLELAFGVPVYGLYGVSEMGEPGMAGECPEKCGLHLAEDQFLAEIVHPLTGEPVPPGQEGELVITTLTAEAYPLIRYRTGDITALREAPCACGRSWSRIAPILRRTDNRLSVRGIPVYPEHVEQLLRNIDPMLLDFRIVIYTAHGIGEQMDLLVARKDGNDFPGGNRTQYLDTLRSTIRRALGMGMRVQLADPERLPGEGLVYKTVFRNLGPAKDQES